MSDNTPTNAGSGGDTIRTVDRTAAKTQVMQLDFGGDTGAGNEQLATLSNPFPVQQAATNFNLSTGNSTVAQLAAGATFSGAIESTLNQQTISVDVTSDQPGVLWVRQFIDAGGTHVIAAWPFQIAAGVPFSWALQANGNYHALSFQNQGAATTTTLNISTAYGTMPSTDTAGNLPVANYGSGDLAGVAIFEALIRGDLALTTSSNNQPKTDANNLAMSSDCPAPVRLLSAVAGQTFILDTLGYPSLTITMGTMAATLTGSNDVAQTAAWASVDALAPSAVAATSILAASTGYVIPCAFRYLKLVVTTAGWATYYLRNIQSGLQLLSQMPCNLTDINGSAVSSTTAQLGINMVNWGGAAVAYTNPVYASPVAIASTNGQTLGGVVVSSTTPAATVIKATAGKITALTLFNGSSAVAFCHLYNAASVTLGTTASTWSIGVPAGGSLTVQLPDGGLYFSTGIGLAWTNLASTTDNTALTAAGQTANYAFL